MLSFDPSLIKMNSGDGGVVQVVEHLLSPGFNLQYYKKEKETCFFNLIVQQKKKQN
jgi:hypothetical protein